MANSDDHGQGTPVGVVRLADVEEKPVEWLAEGVIPFGALTQLIGRGGVGKTTFAAHIGARLTRGQPVFPGLPACDPAAVLILSAEDSIQHVLKGRFRLAGAHMQMVHAINLSDVDVTFPDGLDYVEQVVESLAVRFMVIDPLSGFLGGKIDSHKDASLRSMLRPIHALAERRGMAVLGVLHTNQAQSGDVATKVSGSGAWTNAARSALVFGRLPDAQEDDPGRVVVVAKSNYAKTGEAFEMRLDVPDGESHPVISYVGRSEVDTAQVLADPMESVSRADRTAAVEFLERILADGERLSVDVVAEAEAEGIPERTLQRARAKLGVESRRDGFGRGGKTYIRLPSSAIPRHPSPTVGRDGEVADDGGPS